MDTPSDTVDVAATARQSIPVATWPPAGWVDRHEAARMFGVSWHTWKQWAMDGKITCGQWFTRAGAPRGHSRCKLYPIEGLQRLKEQLRQTVHRGPGLGSTYHVPDGFVGRDEACRMFGISRTRWDRWTWNGRICCGIQPVKNGPTIYAIEDLNRLLGEFGRLAPPYPDPDRPGCYRVPVHGHSMKRPEVMIDAESLPLIAGGRCHLPACGGLGYVFLYTSDGRHDLLHRLILNITDPDLVVGHVNHDPLDCRRANLVVRTHSEKMGAARKVRSVNGVPCTSRFKGVTWDKIRGRWAARISKDGQHYHLGRFNDEIAAAEARDEAARELFGEHARLNFPDGVDAWLETQPAQAA